MTTIQVGENPLLIEAVDEETPLLQRKQQKAPTPLPYLQIGIVLLLQLCEPLCSMSIYPYINEVRSDLFVRAGHALTRSFILRLARQHARYCEGR